MNAEQLRELIADAEIEDVERVVELARPAVSIDLSPLESDSSPIGSSKRGGAPDVPPGFEWPRNQGRAMEFLLQVNLEEAAPHDVEGKLPKRGLLSFFYDTGEQPWGFDPKDAGCARVMYVEDISGLERVADVPTPEGEFVPADWRPDEFVAALRLGSVLTIPSVEEDEVDALGIDDEYDELTEGWVDAWWGTDDERPMTWLLGHPHLEQGPMQVQCEAASSGIDMGGSTPIDEGALERARSRKDRWCLLLQLDSDDGAMWGDCGKLYFWIPAEDLASRDFSQVWLVLQCG